MTKLDNRLTIRLSNAERSAVRITAQKFRLSESEYARKKLGKGELKQILIPQVNQDTVQELAQLKMELNRQGINLNQLVKLLHSQQAAPQIVHQLATLVEVHKQTQATVNIYQLQLIKLQQDDREN